MQSDNREDEHKDESHDDKESIEPAVMARWTKQIEKKTRESKSCYIAHKGNYKQSRIPELFIIANPFVIPTIYKVQQKHNLYKKK